MRIWVPETEPANSIVAGIPDDEYRLDSYYIRVMEGMQWMLWSDWELLP